MTVDPQVKPLSRTVLGNAYHDVARVNLHTSQSSADKWQSHNLSSRAPCRAHTQQSPPTRPRTRFLRHCFGLQRQAPVSHTSCLAFLIPLASPLRRGSPSPLLEQWQLGLRESSQPKAQRFMPSLMPFPSSNPSWSRADSTCPPQYLPQKSIFSHHPLCTPLSWPLSILKGDMKTAPVVSCTLILLPANCSLKVQVMSPRCHCVPSTHICPWHA